MHISVAGATNCSPSSPFVLGSGCPERLCPHSDRSPLPARRGTPHPNALLLSLPFELEEGPRSQRRAKIAELQAPACSRGLWLMLAEAIFVLPLLQGPAPGSGCSLPAGQGTCR